MASCCCDYDMRFRTSDMTTCDSYKCQREEQCDKCFLIDHKKECAGCEHYEH